jgi:hypothetical protein
MAELPSVGNAVQSSEMMRNSLGLNYKSSFEVSAKVQKALCYGRQYVPTLSTRARAGDCPQLRIRQCAAREIQVRRCAVVI